MNTIIITATSARLRNSDGTGWGLLMILRKLDGQLFCPAVNERGEEDELDFHQLLKNVEFLLLVENEQIKRRKRRRGK